MFSLSTLHLIRSPLMAFVAMGVFWGAWSALIPDVKLQIGATDAALGQALLFVSVGAVPAMLAGGRLNDRLGARLLPFSVLFFGLAAFLPMLASGPAHLAVLLFCVGAASGLMDVAMNARVSALEAQHRRHFMNFAHGTFSLTFFVAAVLTGFARSAGGGVLPVLTAVGMLILLLSTASLGPAPRPLAAKETGGASRPALTPVVVLLGLVVFCAFLSENGLQAWSALHLERSLSASPELGSFGPATLGLAIACGRFGGQALQSRVGVAVLLVGAALLADGGVGLFAIAPDPGLALLGLVFAGAGLSVIGPSALSVAGGQAATARRGATVALVSTIAYTGFFVGPALLGFLSETWGLRTALLSISGFCLLIPPFWFGARALMHRPQAAPASLP